MEEEIKYRIFAPASSTLVADGTGNGLDKGSGEALTVLVVAPMRAEWHEFAQEVSQCGCRVLLVDSVGSEKSDALLEGLSKLNVIQADGRTTDCWSTTKSIEALLETHVGLEWKMQAAFITRRFETDEDAAAALKQEESTTESLSIFAGFGELLTAESALEAVQTALIGDGSGGLVCVLSPTLQTTTVQENHPCSMFYRLSEILHELHPCEAGPRSFLVKITKYQDSDTVLQQFSMLHLGKECVEEVSLHALGAYGHDYWTCCPSPTPSEMARIREEEGYESPEPWSDEEEEEEEDDDPQPACPLRRTETS